MTRDARWTLLALSLLALPSCSPDAAAPAPLEPAAAALSRAGDDGPSVSGHTNVTLGGVLQTTSFHGRVDKGGEVKGKLQLDYKASRGSDLKGEVECVQVEGNQAWLGGRITRSDVPEGEAIAFWLRVEDNGEGAGAAPDRWSDVIYFVEGGVPVPDDICAQHYSYPLVPIEGGNIQVRP
jgi:hypothetical protein